MVGGGLRVLLKHKQRGKFIFALPEHFLEIDKPSGNGENVHYWGIRFVIQIRENVGFYGF